MELKADLLLRGDYIDVYTGEILHGEVAIKGERILCVGERVEAREEVSVGGVIVPGLKDGHIHIESSKLTPAEFARVVVPRGTTSVFADPHEIVNVAGKDGFLYMMEEARRVPLRTHLLVPSCVPASPLDESPHELGPEEISNLLDLEGVVGLAEVMNFPGVINVDKEVLKKIEEARKRGKPVDGHAPLVRGLDLCSYIYNGVESDHESTQVEEALEKLRKGMYIMLREGTASKDLWIIKGLNVQRRRVLLVSDDRSPTDLLREGHVDHLLRRAVEEGVDPVEAVQMVTINVAERFGLTSLDGIAPGRLADVVVLKDPRSFDAEMVFIGGRLVAKEGSPLFQAERVKKELGVMKLPPLKPNDLLIKAPGERAKVRVIELTGSLLTKEGEEWLPITEGTVRSSGDVLHLAVIERHGRTGHIGVGFVRGLEFQGAIASTVAHDSHNLVVAGSDPEDMVIASKELERLGGGQTIVSGGEVLATLPLPVGGLMSDLEAEEVVKREKMLKDAYKSLGGELEDPFMDLSFLALPVIPELKLTPKGLVRVAEQEIVSPLLEVI